MLCDAELADSDSRADLSDAVDDSAEWQPASPSSGSGGAARGAFMSSAANIAEDDDDAGGGSSGQDSGQDDDDDLEPRYCLNCTGRLYGADPCCDDCGHCAHDDKLLFDERVSSRGYSLFGTSHSDVFGGGDPSIAKQRQLQTGGLSCAPAALALCFDERMALHEEGRSNPHPERPDRIRAVIARIKASGLNDVCQSVPCREATRAEIESCHSAELHGFLEAHCQGQTCLPDGAPAPITSDTYANRHTFLCARLAAGGAAEVAMRVARGEAHAGAAIVRPPGHHAESNMHMGFCFFNNAAVAARAAQAAGARRVVIFDWDVHHGNGTQHIFEDDPSVLYISIHRYDNGTFYPGTGGVHEVGAGSGEGFTVNVPWNHDEVSNNDYMAAFHHVVLPVTTEFDPDLIIISAGFDAAEGDPIGGCRVTPECFAHMAALLRPVAPVVALLEGGYNLRQTAKSTEATLWAMLGQRLPPLPGPRCGPSPAATRAIQAVLHTQARYWGCLRPAAAAAAAAASGGGFGCSVVPSSSLSGGSDYCEEDNDEEFADAEHGATAATSPPPRRTRQELLRAAMLRGDAAGAAVAGASRSSAEAAAAGGLLQQLLGATGGRNGSLGGGGGSVALSGALRGFHKRRIMAAIHRRAILSYWKRRRLAAAALQPRLLS